MSRSLIRKNQLHPDIADLVSGYGTGFFVTPVQLEDAVNIAQGAVLVSGNQTISGIKTFSTRPLVNGTGVLLIGEAAGGSVQNVVYTTGNQTITGIKTFNLRPTVNGTQVLIQGDNLGVPSETVVYTTGNQTLGGTKTFSTRPLVNGSGVLLQGEAATSVQNVVYTTGVQTISDVKNFTSRPTFNNVGIATTGEVGSNSTAFVGTRPITLQVNGFTNLQPNGDNVVDFLNNLFYPFVTGTVSLNNFPIYTYGVDSISTVNFGGDITLNSNTITGIAFLGNNNTILSGPSSRIVGGSYTASSVSLGETLTASNNEIYKTRIYVLKNGQATAPIDSTPAKRIRFEPRYYYGVSNNSNLGASITTLTPSIPGNYTYTYGSKPPNVTHTFSPVSQYIYFAYPSPASTQDGIINWGDSLTSIFDTNTNFEYISAYQSLGTQNITIGSKTLRYRIYRSNNLLTLLPGQSFTLRFTFGA